MRKFFPVVLAVLSTYSTLALAQDVDTQSKPSTKLEAFQASTGIVIVRGFTTVGAIRGLSGSITVDAREFRDASNPSRRVTGISIEVKETTRLERQNTSFIDFDEIDSLIQGFDYLAKASKEVTTLNNFEVEYRTKGDFRLVVFNNSSGQLSLAVSSGRIAKTSVYLKIEQLSELRELMLLAKSKI
jgi:hypothetical protein